MSVDFTGSIPRRLFVYSGFVVHLSAWNWGHGLKSAIPSWPLWVEWAMQGSEWLVPRGRDATLCADGPQQSGGDH